MSFPLSSLPDELALSCLARVSRTDYRALSLVSKRYRSLVLSPELYKTRSLLGYTEKYLYVCLRTGGQTHNNITQPWLILRRENSKTVMTRFPPFPSQFPKRSSMVALDWGIYVIGGFIKGKPTSKVMLLDCRTNTWRKLPSMSVPRSLAAVGVVDKKIYVFGGCHNNNIDSSNYGEVFDSKTQTWDTLMPKPDENILLKRINTSLVIEEKVYAVENTRVEGKIIQSRGLTYSPSEGKWGIKNIDSESHLNPVYMMIDKLLYCWELSYRWDDPIKSKLFWCETEKEEFKWKEVKGLDFEKLFHWSARYQKISNFGDNIVVFWCVDEEDSTTRSEIWCAEISLERRGDEIWGKVEWLNALITLDHPFCDDSTMVSHSVSVNL